MATSSAAGGEVRSEGTFTDRAHITVTASFKDREVFSSLTFDDSVGLTPFHEQSVFVVCAIIMRQNDVQRVTEVTYLNVG